MMASDLLALAVEAHGGLERWNQLTSVAGSFAIGGAIWGFKGVPGVLADITVGLDLHSERVTLDPVAGADTRMVFEGGRLELRSASGDVVEAVDDPKDAMARLAYDAPWNALDAAYFASEAWWTYLTAPFLFTYPGFRAEEVEHVSASPRGIHSDSLRIAHEVLAAHRERHPDNVIDTFDLFDGTLPVFGRHAAEAKLAHLNGQPLTDEQNAEWAQAHMVFERFVAADIYSRTPCGTTAPIRT